MITILCAVEFCDFLPRFYLVLVIWLLRLSFSPGFPSYTNSVSFRFQHWSRPLGYVRSFHISHAVGLSLNKGSWFVLSKCCVLVLCTQMMTILKPEYAVIFNHVPSIFKASVIWFILYSVTLYCKYSTFVSESRHSPSSLFKRAVSRRQ